MKHSEYVSAEEAGRVGEQLDLPHTSRARKCLRHTTAMTWLHQGWLRDAFVVATMCLRQNPGCKDCRKILAEIWRRM